MKRTVILAGLMAVVLSAPAFAEEQWCKPGTGTPKTTEQLTALLKEKGYDVRKTDTEHGCFEAKAVGPDGKRVELYLDPVTGEIVREKK